MYKKLFEEGKIGSVHVKNRVVMSPMGIGLANLDGTPSDDMIAFYEARAEGGAGLIIPEITRVNDVTGVGLLRQLSVSKDRNIKPLSRLAEAVHKHGSKIFIQLHHPGRETVSALIGGQPVAAPSAIMCKFSKQETRALTHKEVKELVEQFIKGAVRVKKAGCDGVELHAAHGYLINEFLSPYTNKREDEYGGSFENRMRFITEIINGIHQECGDFPISVRLSVEEFLDKTGVTEDYIHIQDGVKIAMALEQLGIDVINVSCGIYETGIVCVEPISYPQGWRKDLIKAVKEHVSIPVIAVSVFREPEIAEQFLEADILDFVGIGRAFLADEQWAKKAECGKEKEICKCISCLRCFESLSEYNAAGLPPECSVNPRMGREKKYGELERDINNHNIVIVGGGPAGLSAARTLAMRGENVTIFEKNEDLGGSVELAKQPPHKQPMGWFTEYYIGELNRLGVKLELNTKATVEKIIDKKPDAVILATGANPIVPDSIVGIQEKHVLGVEEVLTGKAEIQKKKVVVIGAGMTGIETAEYLCSKENQVTIIDMLNEVAPDGNKTNVMDVMGRLKYYGANFILGHALEEIRKDSIVVKNVVSKEKKILEADVVILSLGLKSNRELETQLKEKEIAVYLIGDAKNVGRIAPAVRDGFEIGKELFTTKEPSKSFLISKEKQKRFSETSLMGDQEGIYLCYLSDPEAIRKILPPQLTPFQVPVVTVSINHIKKPTFAEDYYEAILGCYAMYRNTLGAYCFGLVLDGNGAEMATQMGRDNCGLPKKMGGQIKIIRNEDIVSASVARNGVQLVDVNMKIGEYNSSLTDMIYQAPRPEKKTSGCAYYYMFDREPDEEGVPHFVNGRLLQNSCEYTYHTWEPATVSLKLESSIDDPWAELPINTVIGGAYANNELLMKKLTLLERVDAEEVMPYLLKARYDHTCFMGKGSI